MSDRVHPAVEAVKVAVGDEPLDPRRAETEVIQLPAGDNPVLTAGNPGQ